jgi:uncharacterized protein (DUF4415 family)
MNKRSTQQTSELAALRRQKDEDIDLSDIPELSDTSRAVIGKFYRPIKKPVTIRLDADVLGWLKGQGSGYQTRINTILRRAMEREAR